MSANSNVKVDITASAAGMQPAVSQAEQNFSKLEASANKVGKQLKNTNQSFDKATLSAGQLRMATQQLPLQFQDIWVSLAAGQSPMMVMMQQGTQITGSFGGVSNAAKAMGTYLMGLVNPFTVAAAAAAAGAYAWYNWGESARVAADKAREAAKSAEKDAAAAWGGTQKTPEEQMAEVQAKMSGAQGQLDAALIRRNAITSSTSQAMAMAIGAEVLARRKELDGYQRQLDQLKASASKQSLAPVLAIENDLFKKQMDLLGVSSAQVEVYELAMRGATKAEINRAQAAADSIAQTEAQIDAEKKRQKAIEDTNKILSDIEPLFKANQEWAKLLALKEQNLLTDVQMGQAYEKAMGKEKATESSSVWKTFAKDTQRTLSDSIYQGMTGEFGNIEQQFKQLLFRMAANAIAADIAGAMFGQESNVVSGLFGGFSSAAPSFDGGGHTGSGPRSGGIDGKGGFLSILHPQEEVFDHTRGQSSGGLLSVVVHNYSGAPATARETVDSRGQRRLEVVVGEMVGAEMGRPGSAVHRSMRSNFNSQPAMVSR
jgi:hypothetical protein